MIRRALLKGALALTGDGLRRPVNAPNAAPIVPGIQPGNTTPVVRANQVILFGPTGAIIGVYVYQAGTRPAAGNPPIAWLAFGTKDPYGNTLPSTTGIAGTGTFQAGNTIIKTLGEFTYSGPPAAGNLIASITPASGSNDGKGNAFDQGINGYQTVSGKTYAVGLNKLIASWPSLSIAATGANAPTTAGGVNGLVDTTGGTVRLYSGAGTSDVASQVQALSQVKSGFTNGQVLIGAGQTSVGSLQTVTVDDNHGTLILGQPLAATPANPGNTAMFADVNDYPAYVEGLDGQKYNVGHTETSAVGQGLTTTVAALNGTSFTVEATSYRLEYEIFYTGTAAGGVPTFAVTLTGATVGFSHWEAEFIIGGAPATVDYGSGSGFPAMSATGPAVTASEQKAVIRTWITFSAAGTINLNAKMGANTATINAVFSRLERRQ